jgi:hypothetical protein
VPQKIPHGDISRITIIFSFQPCIVWLARGNTFVASRVGSGVEEQASQPTNRRGARLAGSRKSPLFVSHTSAVHMRSHAILKGFCVMAGSDDCRNIVMLFKSSILQTHAGYTTQPCPSDCCSSRHSCRGDTVRRQSPHTRYSRRPSHGAPGGKAHTKAKKSICR